MGRAKVFIFAGIGAMVALTIYGAAATKRAGFDNGHRDRLKRIEALMDEGGVKYRASFFRPSLKKPVHIEKLAGLEPAAVTEVAPPKAPVLDKKAEEAKKAADKKAADEKKKKEDEAKKKKKKKKKKDGTTEETPAGQNDASNDDDKKKDDAAADAGSGGSGGGGAISGGAAAANPNALPQTADDWIAYLLQNPTFEKVSKFIQLAQTGVVKLEVFYPVVEKLLSTDGGRYHEFGVLCLGSVVTSQSFAYLSDVANEQSMEDKNKLAAQQYMLKYAQIDYVGFLGAVATGTVGQEAIDAINVIETSLKNLSASTVTTTPGSSATRAPAASVTTIYANLEASLTTAKSSSPDGTARAKAAQALSNITAILAQYATQTGTTTAATSTTTAAGTSSFN